MRADYMILALKNLKKRGIRSWLTMLGIFIGIAAVVSLISLGQGLREAITGQFAALSTDRLVVSSAETGFGPPGSTAVKKLSEHDLSLIEGVAGVDFATKRIIRVAKVEFNKITNFEFIGSIPEDEEGLRSLYEAFSLEAAEGRLLTNEDRGKIMIGDDFIKNDPYNKRIRVGNTLSVHKRGFEVVGVLKRTSTFQLNGAIFMPEEDMKETLSIGDEIDLIVVRVEDEQRIEQIARDIERKLRKDRGLDEGKEDFAVETPIQSLESVNTILSIINVVVSGIAAISLFVGGIGIANTMYTSVLERTKEIGVMKAIGAKNQDIVVIFLIESGLLGLVGGIIGALIGLGLAFGVANAANAALGNVIFKVTLSLPLLIGAVFFSLFIGILSGIFPAREASSLHPGEALRK